jgi:Sec-independent protein secretion pathway component TatC
MMHLDDRTKQAIQHTYHCLIGCGIGEIVGMLIAAQFGWHRLSRVAIAIVLAFLFGYSLTYRGVREQTGSAREAIKITMATDTVSIVSMELVDNIIEFLIPNALIVAATSPRFWWGLAVALAAAFVITVPVNRYMMARSPHAHHH